MWSQTTFWKVIKCYRYLTYIYWDESASPELYVLLLVYLYLVGIGVAGPLLHRPVGGHRHSLQPAPTQISEQRGGGGYEHMDGQKPRIEHRRHLSNCKKQKTDSDPKGFWRRIRFRRPKHWLKHSNIPMGGPAGHWCHTQSGDTCKDLFMLWTWILISRLAPPLSSLSSHRCGNSCFAATRGRGGKLSLRESNCVTPTLKEQCHDLSTKGETYRHDKWGRCTIYST